MSGRRIARAQIASASIATAILVGGTSIGLGFAQGDDPADTTAANLDTSPSVEITRPAEPLSRDLERTLSPSPTPSASTKPAVVSTGRCAASFYHEPQGTANGEIFNPEALTAAHKTLPFNTRVRVTNPANGKSVTVRINDRGPYIDGRCLDLSRAAFREIANLNQGVLKVVTYEVLAK